MHSFDELVHRIYMIESINRSTPFWTRIFFWRYPDGTLGGEPGLSYHSILFLSRSRHAMVHKNVYW